MRPTIEQKLVLESRLDEVCRAEEAILQAAESFDFSEGALFAIKLALEEALANAVKHGNACDPSKRVTVEFDVNTERLRVSIQDEGPGFNFTDVPDPTLDENLAKPNGRGVMLIRAYMDEVSFNQSGNRVTMSKWCRNRPEQTDESESTKSP